MVDQKYSRFGVSAFGIMFGLLGLYADRNGKILLLVVNFYFHYFSIGFILIERELSCQGTKVIIVNSYCYP